MKLDDDCELAKDAFPLHASSPEENSFLLIFGFPAKKLKSGEDVEMKIFTGHSVNKKSILDDHKSANCFPSDDKNAEEEARKIFDSPDLFLHKCDTLEGNSGSPVLVATKEGYQICGIHTGGLQVYWDEEKSNTKVNYARIIPLSLLDDF